MTTAMEGVSRMGLPGGTGLSSTERLKQARAVMKKLARRGAYIAALPVDRDRAHPWGLFFAGDPVARKRLSQAVLEKMEQQDWVLLESGRYVASRVGLGWLRRSLSGGDFAAQHQDRKVENREIDGEKCTVRVSGCDTPLGWLSRRKDRHGKPMIGAEELQAGLRLEKDFYFAGLQPNMTANWSPASAGGGKSRKHGMGGGVETADHVLASKARIRKATACLGPDMASVALDVCCFHLGLEQLEKQRNWPRRSGKVVLQLALRRLAEHYGLLSQQGEGARGYRPLSCWGVEGYRPDMG